MSDEELLKFAAKGAGYEILRKTFGANKELLYFQVKFKSGKIRAYWNPLLHNSDAFRLIVDASVYTSTGMAEIPFGPCFIEFHEGDSPRDDYALTRRAVVRAVAHLGGAPKDE